MPFAWFSACFGREGNNAAKNRSQKKKKGRLNQVTPSMETKLKNLEIVLKELECPVCFNTCIPPIFTCNNGHIICSKCRRNVHICPTCRQGFSTIRNRFAENFIDQYSQPCKFAKDGCKFLRWKGDNMIPHHTSCSYRMLKCIVPSCQVGVSYRCLLEHLKGVHQIGGTSELPVIIHYVTLNEDLVADRKWLPYYISAFGCTFYVMFEIARPYFWAWVWVHCPKAELTDRFNFLSTLKFQSPKNNMSLEWKGPVYPIRITSAAIIRGGICCGGPEAMLQNFEEDGEINLCVNLERVPGGISDGSVSDGNATVSTYESEILATGDTEREQIFGQLLLAASDQMIRNGPRAAADARNNNNPPPSRSTSRGSSSARSKRLAKPNIPD